MVNICMHKRKENIFALHILVFDESMSAFIPRNLEPLGIEFKCVIDAFSGIILWLEVQEWKETIHRKQFRGLGGTTACILRGVLRTDDYDKSLVSEKIKNVNKKRCYSGDSWFGSVIMAINILKTWHHAVLTVW